MIFCLLASGLDSGEDLHYQGLILLALGGRVAEKHRAHYGQHRDVPSPVLAALVPEPHHVPLSENVMRGH